MTAQPSFNWRLLHRRSGLTWSMLAQRLGITYPYLTKLRSGKSKPSPTLLYLAERMMQDLKS